MYFRLLFLIDKELANCSFEARRLVSSFMKEDELSKVVGRDCYDSFTIGGNWTGTLKTQQLDPSILKAFAREVRETHNWEVLRCVCTITNEILDKKEKALAIFLKYFPDFTGEPPFFRDEFASLGYDDDALLITNERQYYKLLNNYEGEWLSHDYESVAMFNLSRSNINPENVIDKKWVIIVTCHH